jgi:hypothetical protein
MALRPPRRLPLDTADVDAFPLPFHDRPVVVLATDKNDRARSRFGGAHELGHLVMHGEHVWGPKQVESQAALGADPHRPPEKPARLRQIVGVNGVSKAMPRHIVEAIAGANLL